MKLSVPGKTFLVGEYLALSGGPSLLVATEPRFSLEIATSASLSSPFAPLSPAGRFLERHPAAFARADLRFSDPHEGAGGLGASSAQFALLYAFQSGAFESESPDNDWDWCKLLEEYRACAWNGEGAPPSGADVVAQICGGLTEFDGRGFQAKRWEWAFEDLAFTLVRTGHKLATHEHLRKGARVPEESLRPLVEDAKTALQARDATSFARAVQSYGDRLAEAGFRADETTTLLREIEAANVRLDFGLRAAKGCGAMGADIVLILHARSGSKALSAWAEENGLRVCGEDRGLAPGLQIRE